MKKFILAGSVMAALLTAYACTKNSDLTPDQSTAGARSSSVTSGSATHPHSGTATRPQGGTATHPHSGTATPPAGGPPSHPHSGTATHPHNGTATPPASGTAGGHRPKPKHG